MKKILWLLKVIMLLPVIPLIGVSEPESGEEEDPSPDAGTENNDDGGSEEEEEDETVTMTKKELDAMVKKEARKLARKKKEKSSGENDAPPAEDDATAKAEKRMAAANKKMIEGTVKGLAPEMNMTAKGAKAAIRLADFSGCFDSDGELDEDAVSDILEDFLEEWPEFKRPEDSQPSGTGGKGNFPRRKDKPAPPKNLNEKIENKLDVLFK